MLGERLKQLRKERKLSQTALAAAAGIDQRYYSDLERGARTNPSREVIQSLAQALNVPVSTLAEAVWEGADAALMELPSEETPDALLQELTRIWPDLTTDDRETAVAVTRSLWERRKHRGQSGSEQVSS